MISLTTLKDKTKVAEFYKKENLNFCENSNCLTATEGEEVLGYCLFDLDIQKIVVRAISPLEDVLLCDGILRSSLHVACERGVNKAFYDENFPVKLLKTLNFIENEKERTLNINKLFEICCSCK